MDLKSKRFIPSIGKEDLYLRKYGCTLTQTRVYSLEDARDVIEKAILNRKIIGAKRGSSTCKSHLFSTVKLMKITGNATESIVTTILTIVDLAGAERATQLKAGDPLCKETGSVNRSLHVSKGGFFFFKCARYTFERY